MALTQAKIKDILTKLGDDGELRTYASEKYNVATRDVTRGSSTDTTVKMVPPYKDVSGSSLNQFVATSANPDGWKKAEAISIVEAEAISVEINLGMELIYDNVLWKILAVTPLKFKSVVLAWAVGLKKLEGLQDGQYGAQTYSGGYYGTGGDDVS